MSSSSPSKSKVEEEVLGSRPTNVCNNQLKKEKKKKILATGIDVWMKFDYLMQRWVDYDS